VERRRGEGEQTEDRSRGRGKLESVQTTTIDDDVLDEYCLTATTDVLRCPATAATRKRAVVTEIDDDNEDVEVVHAVTVC
jgi:hypothetical protein